MWRLPGTEKTPVNGGGCCCLCLVTNAAGRAQRSAEPQSVLEGMAVLGKRRCRRPFRSTESMKTSSDAPGPPGCRPGLGREPRDAQPAWREDRLGPPRRRCLASGCRQDSDRARRPCPRLLRRRASSLQFSGSPRRGPSRPLLRCDVCAWHLPSALCAETGVQGARHSPHTRAHTHIHTCGHAHTCPLGADLIRSPCLRPLLLQR